MPSEVEEREGGTAISHFGPGSSMDSIATITAWDPPHRFAADSQDMGPKRRRSRTEWIVEARSGGTCVVRVVHSWFVSTDDWDDQFEGHEQGWRAFFRILRLMLTHFRGQRCAAFQLMGVAPEPTSEAWQTLIGSLGLAGATVGQRVSTSAGAPPLAGLVEGVGPSEYPEICSASTSRRPASPTCSPCRWAARSTCRSASTCTATSAPAAAASAEPLWQAWMNEHFAPSGEASSVE